MPFSGMSGANKGEVLTEKRLDQIEGRISALLDEKLDKITRTLDARLKLIEDDTSVLKSENRKLKSRIGDLGAFATRSQVEIVGVPVDNKMDPKDIVVKLARAASIDLKTNHVYSAVRTGRI